MSVNPSASFSSLNFGKFLDHDLHSFETKEQILDASTRDQTSNISNLNPNEAAASKFGIAVQTQRTRLNPAQTKQSEWKYVPGKLTDKNGKVYDGDSTKLADDAQLAITVTGIGKEDSRETILFRGYETVAKAAGYSDEAAARIAGALVAEQKQIEDNARNAHHADGAGSGQQQQQQRATVYNPETKQPRDETYLDNLRRDGQMNFRVTGATLKHMEAVNQQQLSQKQVMDELSRGKMPSDELLQKAGVDRTKLDAVLKEAGWQPVPTFEEAVAKLAAEKKEAALARRKEALSRTYIDTIYNRLPESQMNDEQLTAYTRQQAEVEIKRAIGKGELTVRRSDAPPSISASNIPKWQWDAKQIIEKYLPGVATLNTPEGIKTTNIEAFAYSYINARLFGATDFYVDKSRFQSEKQANEAQAFAMAGRITGELQNLKAVGSTVEAAINAPRLARAIATLKESGTAGKILVQSLPAAATFGSIETIKEGVKAATGQSEGAPKAVTNVARATASEAVFGVLQPLPLRYQLPGVAASSYGIDKIFGASNEEAATSALTNVLFAAVGGRNKAEELNGKTIRIEGANGTAANVKVTVDSERRILLSQVAQNAKADLVAGLPKLREAARVNILNETIPLSKENGGAIFRTAGDRAGELKYLQTMRSRDGIVLKEISAAEYAKAKGTVRELEISRRQFEAANGIRITADGKITTNFQGKLAKNLDSAQGLNLREPRLITPTSAEIVKQVEVQKGLQKVEQLRQEYSLTTRDLKKRNVGFAEFKIEGQQWERTAHSAEFSAPGTSPVPTKRYFKTTEDVYDRAHDSEVKLLEEFAAKYADQAKNVKGTVYLFTERPPCKSCTDVFPQFRDMFPNVKLEIANGGYKEKIGGAK